MRTLLFLSYFVVNYPIAFLAQSDSVICAENCALQEGVYLSFHDFKYQNSIHKDYISSNIDKNSLDFYSKIMLQEKVMIKAANQNSSEFSPVSAWGFCQNNALYLNFNGSFYRVPMFGSISYLPATVEVITPAYYTPGYGMYGSTRTKEIRSFLMSIRDGKIIPYSQSKAEELISDDIELYKEFNLLKKKKRKEQISRYIRKYNERHPIYFYR